MATAPRFNGAALLLRKAAENWCHPAVAARTFDEVFKDGPVDEARDEHGMWTGGGSAGGGYKPGIHAKGVEAAGAKQKEWTAKSPYKSVADNLRAGTRNQRDLTASLSTATDANGGTLADPGLKTQTSIDRKIAMSGRSPNDLTDIVRAGVTVSDPAQSDKILADLSKKYEVIDEGWNVTPVGYFDRKALVRFDDGQVGEVQIQNPDMNVVKQERGHALYEEMRVLPKGDPRIAQVMDAQKHVYGEVLGKLSPDWKKAIGI